MRVRHEQALGRSPGTTRQESVYRLLLIIGLLVILYFLLRSAIREFWRHKEEGPGRNEMVQDPVCRTYVPRGTAVSARVGGQTYFFCSQDCAHAFTQRLSGQQPE